MQACTNNLLLKFYSIIYATSQQSSKLFFIVFYCVYKFRKSLILFSLVRLYNKVKDFKNRLFNMIMIMPSKSTSEYS